MAGGISILAVTERDLLAYTTPWIGIGVGTALVAALEIAFVRLGVFVYKGWHLWLSLLLFPCYFGVIRLYWVEVRRRGLADPVIQAALRVGAFLGAIGTLSLMLWATKVTDSAVRLFPSASTDRSVMRLVLHGIGVMLGYWALLPDHWSERWGRIALATVGMVVVNDLFGALEWLVFLPPFNGTLHAAGVGAATILIGVIIDWVNGLARVGQRRRIPAWEPPEI